MAPRVAARSCRLAVFVLFGCLAAPPARAGFDANGWIVDWLFFGPLAQSAGANPPAATMSLDFLADGDVNVEATILPVKDLEVIPEFLGAAASEGYHAVWIDNQGKWLEVNTAAIAGNTITDTLNIIPLFASQVVDYAMYYAVVYVENPQATPIDVVIQCASDDSIQVKLDDCAVWLNSVSRGFGAVNTYLDQIPVTLQPGVHRVLVKVFTGGGDFGHRLRFADPQGNFLTNLTTPAINVSLEPGTLSEIEPSGAMVRRLSVTPDKVVGTDRTSTVVLEVVKTYPALSDATPVTIRETFPDGFGLLAGSAVPAPTSVNGSTATWELPLGDLVAGGITYEVQFTKPKSGCITGEYQSGPCTLPVLGSGCVFIVAANAIFLGDLVGGGDGTGNKDPLYWGLNTDTGLFMTQAEIQASNAATGDTDGINPTPVEDPLFEDAAEFIDSAFFMTTATMAINTSGVLYNFDTRDPLANGYNHILSNLTNDLDKGPGNIRVGGVDGYATGVGIHSSMGVTFDLQALRNRYGADKIVNFTTVLGTDGCGLGTAANNTIGVYVIYSTEDSILEDISTRVQFTGADQSFPYSEQIPEEAIFLTLATGSTGDGNGCDHGVFAEARIFPELPTARIAATPRFGGPPLPVNFDASTSTPPAGKTIAAYDWDFGDGETGTGVTVSHTYAAKGRYSATLTITDSGGLTDSETVEIQALFQSGNVAPWTSTDIGTPYTVGGARPSGGCIEVFGGGKGTIQAADEAQFVYQERAGNFQLTTRLEAALFEANGRVGLMARESLVPSSAMAFMGVSKTLTGYRATLSRRAAAGDNASTANKNITFQPPALYIKLERIGAECVGSVSDDGTTWTEIGRVTFVVPAASFLVGPAVAALDSTQSGGTATCTFCDLSFDGTTPVETNCTDTLDNDGDLLADCDDPDCASAPSCQTTGAQFRRGDSNADGQLNITDGIFVLNYLFLGGPTPPCLEAANPNDDTNVNITDGIYILNFLFLGGPAPAAPGSDACGVDPPTSVNDFGCETYERC